MTSARQRRWWKRKKEAEVKEAVDPTFTLISWAGETYSTAAAQVIQQDLSEVGFHVKLQPLDLAAAAADVEGGEYDASMTGYFSTSPDPSENVSYYLGSLAEPSGVDTTRYTAPFSQSAATDPNSRTRRQKYFQLQELVAEQEQGIVIDYQPNLWAKQKSVVGFELNPLNVAWLANTGFSK